MNMRMMAAVGLLTLLAASAHAQNPNVVSKNGYYFNPQTGQRTDVDGRAIIVNGDPDRDFPVITNLFNSVVLNAGTTFQPNTPKFIGQYSRAALMVTFGAAAADSDSVRFGIRVYGKTSLQSGNMYLWTPQIGVGTGDSCNTNGQVQADSAGGVGRCLQPFSFVVSRRFNPYRPAAEMVAFIIRGEQSNAYEGTFTTPTGKAVRIRKIPAYAWRQCSQNAVMLNLADNAGANIPYPYIFVEIVNLTIGSNLTSVTCDVWPRVN